MGIGGTPHIKPNRQDWVPIWARVYTASDSELSSLGVFNSSERFQRLRRERSKKTERERKMDTPSNLDEQVST